MTRSGFNPIIQEDVRLIQEELGEALHPLSGTVLVVSGAGGFLCSYFLDLISRLNRIAFSSPCRAIALDNFKTGLPARVEHLKDDPHIRFVVTDVTRPIELPEPVDWIIHGASIASPMLYRRFPLETIDVNVAGTRHLLELARAKQAKSMLSLSSSEIYGDPDPRFIPTSEEYRGNVSCTGPRACYDESKRLGETLCTTYFRLYRTPVKIIRPFNVYGPGQRLDDQRIIPDLISAAIEKRPVILYSDGMATRSFCYVRDAIRAMLHILLSPADGECFNVGTSEEVSIKELSQVVAQLAGPPPLTVEHRLSRDKDYILDNPQRRCPSLSKIQALTPWRPVVSLREGLDRTLRSYQTQGALETHAV